MIKGKTKVVVILSMLLLLLNNNNLNAQVEVVPLEDEETKVYYFDSLSPQSLPVIEERKIPDSIVQKLQNEEAFWYANAHIKKEEATKKGRNLSFSWLNEKWVRSALWLLIIGLFAAVVVWYLSNLNVRLFRKPSANIQTSIDDTIKEDIFSIAYPAEINRAIQANNYRQAIRLYYLQALALLSQKNWIKYKQDLTNQDYVRQLLPTFLYKDFFKLTRHFEYIWYGNFELNTPAFNLLQKDFETFYKQLQA